MGDHRHIGTTGSGRQDRLLGTLGVPERLQSAEESMEVSLYSTEMSTSPQRSTPADCLLGYFAYHSRDRDGERGSTQPAKALKALLRRDDSRRRNHWFVKAMQLAEALLCRSVTLVVGHQNGDCWPTLSSMHKKPGRMTATVCASRCATATGTVVQTCCAVHVRPPALSLRCGCTA